MREQVATVSVNFPPTVVFDLNVADSARLRVDVWARNGGRMVLPLLALGPLLQSGTELLRLYRSGWNDAQGAVLLVLESAVLAGIGMSFWWPRWWQLSFLRPQLGTSVSFDAAGIEIERGLPARRTKRFVPFTKIRSVLLMPDALFVMAAVKPLVIIPRAALSDDGNDVIAFFEENLVSKRLLRRSSFGRTTIVNSASP